MDLSPGTRNAPVKRPPGAAINWRESTDNADHQAEQRPARLVARTGKLKRKTGQTAFSVPFFFSKRDKEEKREKKGSDSVFQLF
jgi:hypothetical protein